ncbi:unnamed protein product [Pleuronectes platessa]|uniref:Uncharacterized protein n=1 Tax=Pleuronectes platessa TaxID=8262 RepID=A0A9N7UE93_PLEPL|nr:unnamed protein product [Pleuronectes platessa]
MKGSIPRGPRMSAYLQPVLLLDLPPSSTQVLSVVHRLLPPAEGQSSAVIGQRGVLSMNPTLAPPFIRKCCCTIAAAVLHEMAVHFACVIMSNIIPSYGRITSWNHYTKCEIITHGLRSHTALSQTPPPSRHVHSNEDLTSCAQTDSDRRIGYTRSPRVRSPSAMVPITVRALATDNSRKETK